MTPSTVTTCSRVDEGGLFSPALQLNSWPASSSTEVHWEKSALGIPLRLAGVSSVTLESTALHNAQLSKHGIKLVLKLYTKKSKTLQTRPWFYVYPPLVLCSTFNPTHTETFYNDNLIALLTVGLQLQSCFLASHYLVGRD